MKTHYKNEENSTVTIRKLREHFGVHDRLSPPDIENLIIVFVRTLSLKDERNFILYRPKDRLIAKHLHLTSFPRVKPPPMNFNKRFAPSCLQDSSDSRTAAHRQRINFTYCILEQLQVDDAFHNKIIFSNEALCHLNGFVNKQNSAERKIHMPLHELPMYLQKVTLWCAIVGRKDHRNTTFLKMKVTP